MLKCNKSIYRLRASRKVMGSPGGKPLGSLVFFSTGHVGRETFRPHCSYGCHRHYNQYCNFKQIRHLKIAWQFSRA